MNARRGIGVMALAITVLLVAVYFGNFTSDPQKNESPVAASQPQAISFDDYEKIQIKKLTPEQAGSIINNKKKLTDAIDDTLKAQAYHTLAHTWKDLGQPVLEAYYHFEAGVLEKDPLALEQTGDSFFSLFGRVEDTLIKNNLSIFALRSYEAALQLQPDNIDLKVKTGSAYVEASAEPMKGIALIREVIAAKPDHIPALLMLARFSIVSGQYDKAKERLDEVLKLDPGNTEAIYFMAITQEGLGNIDKAIELLEVCKKIVGNPDFDKEIDNYIVNLKNKKNK